MARRTRSRSRGSESRRKFLFRVGAGSAAFLGVAAAARETGAFTSVTGDRTSSVDVAPAGEGLIGLVDQGPVKKNLRDPMVEITNNSPDSLTFLVELDDCSDGTLYDNDGESGCSVTFTLPSGNTQTIDIVADVQGTIPYSITTTDPGFSFDTSTSVESQAANVVGAVNILKPNQDGEFTADTALDRWEVKNVDVRDEDGDDDLDRIEFEVFEGASGGTVVGSKTLTSIPGDKYAPGGPPPDEIITPDSGSYTLKSGQLYTLKVQAFDADGNFDTETLQDTTSGTPTATDTPTDTPADTPTDTPGGTPTDTPGGTPTDTPTATPTPSNQPPTADFTHSRKGKSTNVDLDGSSSSDPDGSISSYEWDVGDDGTVDYTGQTVTNASVGQGEDVTLTVTDNDGATDSVTKTVP